MKFIYSIIILFLFISCFGTHSSQEEDKKTLPMKRNQKKEFFAKEGEKVRLRGILRFVGNEPFASLVIQDEMNQYFTIKKGKYYSQLLNLQSKTIKLEGIYYQNPGKLIQASGSVEVIQFEEEK